LALPWEILLQLVASLGVGVIVSLFQLFRNRKREKETEERTSEKFERISNILKEASSDIEKLEGELRAKGKKLEELKELSERLDTLVSLQQVQVDAIRREFSIALKESSKTNSLWTILIGALWLV